MSSLPSGAPLRLRAVSELTARPYAWLSQRQKDWNERASQNADSSMAKDEKKMASEADSLAARLQALQKMIEQIKDKSQALKLKSELDRLGLFKQFEDRFLDLFKKDEHG